MVVEGEGADPLAGAESAGQKAGREPPGPSFHVGPAHFGGSVRRGRDQAAERGDGPGSKGQMLQQESAGWDHGGASKGDLDGLRKGRGPTGRSMGDDNSRSPRSRRFLASTEGQATNTDQRVG